MTVPISAAPGSQVKAAHPDVTPRRRGTRRRWRRTATPYLFLIVPVVLLLVFTYLPVANMFWYSFNIYDGLNDKEFIGFKNYREFYTRPELFRVFYVSLYYIGASVIQMALALYFATILTFRVRFKNVFKGILFFPYLINGVAIAFVFLYFFKPGGTLDSILRIMHVTDAPPQWLGNPDLVNYSLASTSIWRYMGLNFVLFLGAIQSIPGQLYEAAEIDGAARWQQFRYIIAPGIKPIIGLSFILAISGSLAVFEIPYIMLGGANGSKTFVIQTVQTAFNFKKFGLGSAMAVVLLIIVLLVTWVQRRLVPDERVNLT